MQTLTNDWKDASFPPSLPNRHLSETERVYALPLSGRGGGGGDGDSIDREIPLLAINCPDKSVAINSFLLSWMREIPFSQITDVASGVFPNGDTTVPRFE